MTKKIRLAILTLCALCFFIVTPILVFYSMGYRFDLNNGKITKTGGIYIKSLPAPDGVVIGSKISEKPTPFANDVFVQGLLPGKYTVLVKKGGYYDYFKTISVSATEVTKLENIILFKKDIKFEIINDPRQSPFENVEKFIFKNNNLYYSDSPENTNLTRVQKTTPVIKNLIAFSLQNSNILWLGTDGFIYKINPKNLSEKPLKITNKPLEIEKNGKYKIIADKKNILVNDNGKLLILNSLTKNLETFYQEVNDAKLSPDGKNVVYYDDKNLYITSLSSYPETKDKAHLLYKTTEKIIDCGWLNNNYIVLATENKIIICETDYRENINFITLPQTVIISPQEKVEIRNPKIYFNQKEGRLYILTGEKLLVSENFLP